MILEFGEEEYIDVEKIDVIRWLPRKQVGMLLVEGERIFLDRTSFNLVMKAYIYLHKSHMYGDNLKQIRWVKHTDKSEPEKTNLIIGGE